MPKMLDKIAVWLLIIGGLNIGLSGVFNYNLIEAFISNPGFLKLIYGAVGLSAVYSIWQFFNGGSQ